MNSMATESARIGELEQTIESLVSYLRRLPVNPETYVHANSAEKVLRKPVADISLRGQKYLPSGIVLLTVEMSGLNVSVSTQDVSGMSELFQQKHKVHLFDALVDGVSVKLSGE